MVVPAEQVPAYLAASLAYAGIDWRDRPDSLRNGFAAYREVTGLGYFHLPFHLVHDLAEILARGSEAPFMSDQHAPVILEPAALELRNRYEREFLGRLPQAPDVVAAMEIAETSESPEAVRAHLLAILIKRFAPLYPAVATLNPAFLRGLTPPSPNSKPETATSFDFEKPLAAFLAAVSEEIRWGQLLYEEDFFELTHLSILATDHLRVGCRQILRLDRELSAAKFPRIDLTQHEPEADTTFLDETHYPTGGLSGLTNRGSFENLVMSELIYMDEEAAGTTLFNLRYVEGEVLYYLRDSGILRRKRRTIHLVTDLGGLAHVKTAAYRYQFSVLAQGFALRLLRDLFRIFETDSLRFHLHYLPTGDSETLAQEVDVMRLLLRDDALHGWVQFATPESLELYSLLDPTRKTYVIVLAGPETADDWARKLASAAQQRLALHGALLRFGMEGDMSLPMQGAAPEEMIACKDRTLTQILS